MGKTRASSRKPRESGTSRHDDGYVSDLARAALDLLGESSEWLLGTSDEEEVERVRGELDRLANGGAPNAFDLTTGRALAVAEWSARADGLAAKLMEKFRRERLGHDARPALSQDLASQLAGLATSAWRLELPGDTQALVLAKNRVTGVLRGEPVPLEAYLPLPSGGCVATVLLAARSLQNAVADATPEVSETATVLLQELLHAVTTSELARVGDDTLGRDFTAAVFELIAAAHPNAPETRVSDLAAEVAEFLAFEARVKPDTLRRRMQRARKKTQ